MTLTETALARAAALDLQLAAAGAAFAAAVRELEPLAAALADLEGRHRAAAHAAGVTHTRRTAARELAAEVLHGTLGPLRPFVPHVTGAAAERAAEALSAPHCGGLRYFNDGEPA